MLYSLRKYLRLAIKGNPTVMLPLFAPDESLVVVTPLGEELRTLRGAFLSQLAVERFLGYMRSQHGRMLGRSKRNVPNRPELIEKYGWDVKYGSHALRLAYQGYEIASTGSLSLPLPDRERARVLAVKRGEVDRDEISARSLAWRTKCELCSTVAGGRPYRTWPIWIGSAPGRSTRSGVTGATNRPGPRWRPIGSSTRAAAGVPDRDACQVGHSHLACAKT